MRIACLACGPSLPLHWGRDKGQQWDAVVAVNTAGWLYGCDWLAFADKPIGDAIQSGEADPPRLGYLTHPRTPLPRPGARAPFPLKAPGVCCSFAEYLPRGEDQLCCAFTFPNALAFCAVLAARSPTHATPVRLVATPSVEVHVYGMDFAAQRGDVCGQGGDHKLHRWLSELPWIKHAWFLLNATPHGDAPGAVVAWLEDKEPSPRGWEAASKALEERCAVNGMC